MKKNIDKKLFGERLKQLMNSYNETTYSIGKKFNLSPPTISRYTRGEMEPKMTTLVAIADYFNVNPDWLTGESSSILETELIDEVDTDFRASIPVFRTIRYDLPVFSNEKITDELKVPEDKISKWGAFISMVMPDDSMSPTLEKNDRIVIKLNPSLQSHKLAALHVNRNDLIIRRVIVDGRYVILQPDNLEYKAEIYNLNRDDIQIIGNVVYRQHISEEFLD